MRDATAQEMRGGTHVLEREDEIGEEVVERVGAAIGQRTLGQRPDALIGIDLRSIRGEVLEMDARVARAEFGQRPAVDASIVQQHDDVAAEVAPQLTDEGVHLLVSDVVPVELVVQAEAPPAGTDGNAGDHGDLVAPRAVAQHRRTATWRPGLEDRGQEQEARFVGKDEVGVQARGLFFTAGQCTRFQRAMAASSRSAARRSGFWWLHPN